MATISDLYQSLSEMSGWDLGRLRYAVRVGQRAGLLPVGPRGGGREAPQLTSDDCAWFVILLGVTQNARSQDIAQLAKRYAKLRRERSNGTSVRLFDDIRYMINSEVPLLVGDGKDFEFVSPSRFLFIGDKKNPVVELLLCPPTDPKEALRWVYSIDGSALPTASPTTLDTPVAMIAGQVTTHLSRLLKKEPVKA